MPNKLYFVYSPPGLGGYFDAQIERRTICREHNIPAEAVTADG